MIAPVVEGSVVVSVVVISVVVVLGSVVVSDEREVFIDLFRNISDVQYVFAPISSEEKL